MPGRYWDVFMAGPLQQGRLQELLPRGGAKSEAEGAGNAQGCRLEPACIRPACGCPAAAHRAAAMSQCREGVRGFENIAKLAVLTAASPSSSAAAALLGFVSSFVCWVLAFL